jgi:hypothetical protein
MNRQSVREAPSVNARAAAPRNFRALTLDKCAARQNDTLALMYERFRGAGMRDTTRRMCAAVEGVEIAR